MEVKTAHVEGKLCTIHLAAMQGQFHASIGIDDVATTVKIQHGMATLHGHVGRHVAGTGLAIGKTGNLQLGSKSGSG